MAEDDEHQGRGASTDGSDARQVRAYRTPRYSVFLLTGAVLGLLGGLAVALLGGSSTDPGSATAGGILGYFVAFGTLLGALLAGTLAVLVESLLNRGRRTAGRARSRRPDGGARAR